MKKVLRANLYFLIIILLEIFLPVVLAPIYHIIGLNDIRVMLVLNHTIIFIIPAIIYLLVTKSNIKETLRLNKLYIKDALLIILMAFLCQPIMMFFSLLTGFFFDNEIGNFMNEILNTPYLVLLGLIAVLPAISEELTIRGVVLSGYNNKNKYVAALMTGLFFGIFHLDPQQFLYATVLGFILALVVRNTNSIFGGCLLHFIINGTSITMQKLMQLVPQNTEIIDQAAELSLKALPVAQKMVLAGVYGTLAIAFGALVYLIIMKLEELNIRRGIIAKENIGFDNTSQSKENVLNWPFVVVIVVYLIYMVLSIMLK